MPDTLVSIKNLTKRFPVSKSFFGKPTKFVHAVNDVSFDIAAGETFAIVGESGCGKSTTSRLLDHLIKPDEGEIWFDGREISKLSDKQMRPLRSDMQVVFQDPYGSLNPRMKVQDIISEPLLVHTSLSTGERLRRAQELLDVVGLSAAHGERYPHEFSGGQRQRIGIARALSVQPKLIIADEPVSALDVSIQAQVLNLLRDLQEKFNLTYLFISHDLAVVEMISDRIAVMYLGSIMEVAPNEDLYRNPRHPYTQALLSAVPVPDPEIKKHHVLLEGDIPTSTTLPSGCPFRTRCPHATEKCAREVPPDTIVEPGHVVRCHYPDLTL
ncbi:oligopeptide/dipeptide ABC transporter, ATPase subunit [Coriobacterium glomerans PW2]|uniref:Oligopeptide/dipeptide ABC transporter, ATPase subunit n=1 Tax=Coriobacterium glomerans (strain ATCC 49209 / DSM 20642 / JCM 10262 / PW2) TaxID=700015 RepID=F2N8E3_CORGP|nr:oligopeptide/dipeptide ABC transporter ATP-binding protein [Coriobacterium glomerans]AEB07326.1 oligopeptide/dipeptide ABC transporter, ATPase subunit [Coriobacterium glomerans PW2]